MDSDLVGSEAGVQEEGGLHKVSPALHEPLYELVTMNTESDEMGHNDFETNDHIRVPIIVHLDELARILVQYIEGQNVKALVDTGASVSVVPRALIEDWLENDDRVQMSSYTGLTPALFKTISIPNGDEIGILGKTVIGLKIGDVIFDTDVHIVDKLENVSMVLGRDFLRQYGVHISYAKQQIIFTPMMGVTAVKDYKIKAGQHMAIKVATTVDVPTGVTGTIYGIKKLNRRHECVKIHIGEIIVRVEHNQTLIHMYNPNPYTIHLYEGETLGIFEPVVGLETLSGQQSLWAMYIPDVYKCEQGKLCPGVPDPVPKQKVGDTPVEIDLTTSKFDK